MTCAVCERQLPDTDGDLRRECLDSDVWVCFECEYAHEEQVHEEKEDES